MSRLQSRWILQVALLLAGGVVALWLVESPVPIKPPVAAEAAPAPASPAPERDSGSQVSPAPKALAPTRLAPAGTPQPAREPAPAHKAVPLPADARDSANAVTKEITRQLAEAEKAAVLSELAQVGEPREKVRNGKPTQKFKVTLAGTVVAANGQLAKGAYVVAGHQEDGGGGPRTPASYSASICVQHTDAEGKFRFDYYPDLPAETRTVTLFVSAGRGVRRTFHAEDAIEVTLFNGGVKEDLRLQLRPEGQAKGRVVDAQGKPVAGATVHFTFAESSPGGMNAIPCGKQGEFMLESLEPLQYIFAASDVGLRTSAEGVRATVVAGQMTTLPDLVLEKSAVLIVNLTAPDKSVASQLVRLDLYAEGGAALERTSGRTDENGEVHFSQLPPGTLRFVIRCPGCNPTERLTTRLSPGETYKYGAIALSAAKGR